MNLFFLLELIGIALGAVTGWKLGLEYLGGYASAVGSAVGGAVVFRYALPLLALASFLAAAALEEYGNRLRLRPYFGRYWKSSRAAAWRTLKDGLAAGTQTRGRVVVVRYFGRFMDIGAGFPALLSRRHEGTTTEPMPLLNDWDDAVVLSFDDANRVVVLTRHRPTMIAHSGVVVAHLLGEPPIRQDGVALFEPVMNTASAVFVSELRQDEALRCELLRPGEPPERVLVERYPVAGASRDCGIVRIVVVVEPPSETAVNPRRLNSPRSTPA